MLKPTCVWLDADSFPWLEQYVVCQPNCATGLRQKCLSMKGSTTAVRLGYLLCMEVALKGTASVQLQQLSEPLTKTVEKAAANPAQVGRARGTCKTPPW